MVVAMKTLDIERRAPVWEALSELFVGKELQDYDYATIATTLRASGYSLSELETILHQEVAPVFRGNLSALAVAEMEGWARETVVADVRAYLERERSGPSRFWARLVTARRLPDVARDRWERVKGALFS
jgi:hypothetical protein